MTTCADVVVTAGLQCTGLLSSADSLPVTALVGCCFSNLLPHSGAPAPTPAHHAWPDKRAHQGVYCIDRAQPPPGATPQCTVRSHERALVQHLLLNSETRDATINDLPEPTISIAQGAGRHRFPVTLRDLHHCPEQPHPQPADPAACSPSPLLSHSLTMHSHSPRCLQPHQLPPLDPTPNTQTGHWTSAPSSSRTRKL
ncbi:multiple epidermal growth factor-like domains protein 10 [Lates japonicus]|uniref:Multiple epidermal growth factor-like domains protein 10 n=1 Tax=Lates japonicus TaxID=270547 RepID=A0AAD3RIX0_LATJO|nr:multiple epidermal growth factor-like domains protein 10 [Lates japonicus]